MTLPADKLAAVPFQIWILFFLAVTAWAPASYVWRYLTHARAPRDITLPPEDLSWKSRSQFYRGLAVLAVLAGIGVFIFTPQAEAFARSDWLFPTLGGVFGSYALGTVVPGWRNGEIEPLIRGVSTSFRRDTQPRRYWASLAWNALLGAGLMAVSFGVVRDIMVPQCRHDGPGEKAAMAQALSACGAVLEDEGLERDERAEATATKGRLHHELGQYPEAIAAYSQAIVLDPGDSYSLFSRGVLRLHTGDAAGAIADFDASLAIRPENRDARISRGWAHLRLGSIDRATSDFAELGGEAPTRQQMLARAAEFAIERGDFDAAIRLSSQALELDPADRFALRLRAEAYWKTGQEALSQADDDRVRALEGFAEP